MQESRLAIQLMLQGCAVLHVGRQPVRHSGHHDKPVGQFVIDLQCDIAGDRLLLITDRTQHVLLQDLAHIEGVAPDAERENGQREHGNPCLQGHGKKLLPYIHRKPPFMTPVPLTRAGHRSRTQ